MVWMESTINTSGRKALTASVQICFDQDEQLVQRAAETLGPKLQLPSGFLSADIQDLLVRGQ